MATSTGSRPVALITGGTTGIGFATARLLLDKGFAVVVTGQSPERVAAAQQALGDHAVALRADARSLADAGRVAAELRRRYGKVDLAFLNAGVGRMVPFDAVDEAHYDDTFDINVKGQLFLLHEILPLLTRGSSVIFNGALSAYKGIPNFSIYSATKGAIRALVPALAVELAPRGIRVNAVVPGPIETPAFAKLGLTPEALGGFRETLHSRTPLGRIGTTEEVAEAVAFLASPAAGFMTGASIAIDGGMGAA